MARLLFDARELKPIVEHTLRQTAHVPTFDLMLDPTYWKPGVTMPPSGFPTAEMIDLAKVPPSLTFVKDRGVYLMSSAAERLLADGATSVVCYAKGHDPRTDEDWYDEGVRAVGGDDFAESLPIEWFTPVVEDATIRQVALTVTGNDIRIGYVRRRD